MADSTEHAVPLTPIQLAHINRLSTIARLVSGLTHELNNSLQVMTGLIELLADRADLPLDAASRIQRIGTQAERASGAIRDVLSYAREPAGATTAVDLPALVARALALRRYQLDRGAVRVTWQRPADIGRVPGVEPHLHQVILNLLVNAEEALAGQRHAELAISAAGHGNVVSLTITDSGPGVPAELAGRIFEPFFTTRTAQGAVGLGLTVSASIVAAHGGRLYLASGHPATFVLELPTGPAS